MNNRTPEQVVDTEGTPNGTHRCTAVLIGAILFLFSVNSAVAQSEKKSSSSTLLRGICMDLAEPAQALGDRLRQTGKERLAVSALISLNGQSSTSVVILRESPGKVRIVQEGKAAPVVFNSSETGRSSGVTGKNDEDLLETLVYDWPDHFFIAHGSGSGLRLVARRVVVKDGADPSGVFDVYDAVDTVEVGKTRVRVARYYLHSDTGLLGRVKYSSALKQIEVRFTDWQLVEEQRVPGKVERLEEGKSVLTVKFATPLFAPATADSAFSLTGN